MAAMHRRIVAELASRCHIGCCTICGGRCEAGSAGSGVAPHVGEMAIGHARAGVQAIYDKHKYEPEIKAAFP